MIQFASILFVSLIVLLLRPIPVIYEILIYGFVPCICMYSAGKLVLKGINPYLTWILPPIGETAAGFLITMGFGPQPLPIMITAFLSLVGAAAGDVMKKAMKKDRK